MAAPLEIERVYLLRGMPQIPRGAEQWHIEQGYLPRKVEQEEFAAGGRMSSAAEPCRAGPSGDDEIAEGRIRRVVYPDGRVSHQHTIKRGMGLVREEREQDIPRELFERLWPTTAGMQLRKTRYRLDVDGLIWEVDQFHDLDLVLAEVELPQRDTPVTIPSWLQPFIVREVTDEPAYRNFAIAKRVGLVRRQC